MNNFTEPSRRDFLRTSAVASGLLLCVSLPSPLDAKATGNVHTLNAWVHIADDNSITLITARSEMGQGVYTALPMLLAEELGVDLASIKVEVAPPNAKAYGNALVGGLQLTGGSTSVRDGWDRLRIAGAQAREMLAGAAAARWKVTRDQVRPGNGFVTGPGGRKASFGELAAAAATMPLPEKPPLKDPKDFRLVGKSTRRLDTPAKVNGTARFGIDVKLPGMLYAALEQCPVIGGTVKTVDSAKAKGMPGVVDVVQIPDGVAVVADSWWRANQARKALVIEWDEGAGAALDHNSMLAGTRAALDSGTPKLFKANGDANAVIAASSRVVRAEYVSHLLSHAALEPMNFTAHYNNGRVHLIGPTQWQDLTQTAVAKALGIKPEDVTLETTFLGGSFGRRQEVDFVVQAAQISKAVGKPVKLLWSREDDMTHDFYRPQAVHRVAAALGSDGKPTAMTFRMASQSVGIRVFGIPLKVQDPTMTESAVAPYEIAATRHDVVKHDAGLRVGYWRSVSNPLNVFANECFIDELAKEAGQDPYAYRLSLLGNQPRFVEVLKLAAEKSGWGKPLPAGRARGIALMEAYNTYMAQVAEISLDDQGAVKVHRVVVAADLGRMVNPDTVEAQIQSSVIFGMGAALSQEITLEKGRVQQTNFHEFPVVRMNEVPAIDIVLVDSTEAPGGIGEPATAVIMPALANAVAALTSKRLRKLPMTAEAIKMA
ncbi:xanthine dehydrogenase family protein molybdopterin-binding subunit [Bradyrhizobium sp. 195]|uniref:xanthine dehydrogenase family protein molybdopterin-binding subunit n=1 Tax=Bradyrhizobium sp. 195 TaxID=2782662 RepID=UPI0020013CA8|nr:xanthine dehydrogenase family protein molybdopterin-binding subunit [Bradyrhizobium sp. 195]UPK29163.1 xanthine dehydrogenase family protein molybdopterin-binding subunit [Bradyrhizobium sp. 195]